MGTKLGFIGTGFMGAAMIKGIINSGIMPAENLNIFDVNKEKAILLKNETGANVVENIEEVVEKSDVIILAVKPNVVKPALESCKDKFDDKKILISIAAGIPIKTYKDVIGSDRKVVRVMPNTPAVVGEGMTIVSYDNNINKEDEAIVKSILGCMGKVEVLDEKLMSEVIALTGSSPAYVFMFIEAMADAAVLAGIPRNLAYKLAAQSVLGSAKMVLETGKHPGELKDQVCSPAGTTIEAVSTLEKNGFRYAVIDAMNECTRRAKEIGKIYG
ncbi:MAG: pyrroline-5-carboxylate reductase [Clostridia bacterium]|nr:pyrroline-5-carboxylate reductase [Clostridia bacterium]